MDSIKARRFFHSDGTFAQWAVMRLGEVHTFYIFRLYVGGGLLTIDTDPFIKALAAFQSAEKKNKDV